MMFGYRVHDAVWVAWGWTMVHELWVGGLIGVVAGLLSRLSRRARPETRYGIAVAALLVLAVSPLAVFLSIDRGVPRAEPLIVAQTSKESIAIASSGSDSAVTSQPRKLAVLGIAPNPRGRDWTNGLAGAAAFLPWLWIAGSSITLMLLGLGVLGVERFRRTSRAMTDPEILRIFERLIGSLALTRRVGLAVCDRVAGPILLGVVRPLVLLPAAALTGWTADQLEMALLHELLHVKRWDNLVNLLQRLVESLLFFQPAAWWLSRWVRLERELACDRRVVSQLGQREAYAELLLLLAAPLKEPVRSRALAMIAGSLLEAGDRDGAAQTTELICDYLGLEKCRGLGGLASAYEKEGDTARAKKLIERVISLLEAAPTAEQKSRMGPTQKIVGYAAHSYVDFEREFDPALVDWQRKTMLESLRMSSDEPAALEAARKLSAAEADAMIGRMVSVSVYKGKGPEALELLKLIQSPSVRLSALQSAAVAIRDRGRSWNLR